MDTQNHQFAELTAITASVVPDELRIGFWPKHFGSIPQWITLEPRIFAWMDRLCTDYHGGIWNFSTLSNGAELAGEAAGIVACLMAYSHHACRTESDAMTEHYYRLRDFALNHPECSAIMHLID